MLELDEKVILQMKSGYSLIGLEDFDLSDKCLQLTNLGNIYISKVDCLNEDIVDYIEYKHKDTKRTLNSELDGDVINVIAESLPFRVTRGDFSTVVNMDLLMILELYEYINVNRKSDVKVVELNNNISIVIIDNEEPMLGTLEHGEKRFIFNNSKNRVEVKFEDVESCVRNENTVTLRGYFFIEKNALIARKISIVGNIKEYIIPSNFLEIISSNPKLGKIPDSDEIVFCKISGKVRGNEYLSKNFYLIKHRDLYVFYEKKSKTEIICRNISHFSKLQIDDNSYIVYDGIDVFNLYIDVSNAKIIGLNKVNKIIESRVGFTKEYRPFFIDIDGDELTISKANDKVILSIKKSDVSDISIHDRVNIGNEDYIETEIKYSDKLITVNLKKSIAIEISSKVFYEYQRSIIEKAEILEVYDNWIKSTCDMVLFNMLGHIYYMKRRYVDFTEDSKIDECVDFINEIHEDLYFQMERIDCISVSMSEMLDKSERRYFKGLDIEYKGGAFEKFERDIFNIRNDIKYDIKEIIDIIGNLNYMILPETMRKSSIRLLKESQIYQIDYFSKLVYSKLNHLIYDMLPHYISRIIKTVFYVYTSLYNDYRKINSDELKIELIDRINSTHIFKQFRVNEDSDVLRKEVIDDMYSLTKFSFMKVDSEYYYTVGYK